ncbi:N,N'-diacetyllegionaminic acid synthase [Hydrogenovibrio crunogenus]|uniref:N,N'-diacetyllegionaminic acid synthase n=1 Tax=Hydrogenovibrio crunogenus TaxID=39765 RepID=A0A4P7P0A1_9GAMM|nr:N-acetylneuraminate synthase [Hydrogenovibrio crunogenus]QBZ83487.1 N,N'-diacetyllegionaminic acid synthase [Hydrogenovibrio crunogenus]
MSVFIIAEAGVNHNGDLQSALRLIDAAVEAGANAVKFQTFNTQALVSKSVKQADYQAQNTGKQKSQYELLKSLELSEQDHRVIIQHCLNSDIEFMSTAFDDESIRLLHQLGMARWKIPSGELLSVPYLRKIAAYNQPTILSTGMGSLEEVQFSVNTLLKAGLEASNLTVLHANTAYPTPYEDVNLNAMQTLEKVLNLPVGLSDHSLGIEVPIAAVAMGAQMIEKHFTLDKSWPGPDHKASLNPSELKTMVTAIRHVEQALGHGEKTVSASESMNIAVARKRIVAARPIPKNTVFSEENITLKRSDSGVFATEWDQVIGQKSTRDYQEDEGIELD